MHLPKKANEQRNYNLPVPPPTINQTPAGAVHCEIYAPTHICDTHVTHTHSTHTIHMTHNTHDAHYRKHTYKLHVGVTHMYII